MKRVFKILIFITILAMVAAAALAIYIDSFYWEHKSSLASPDKKFTVHEYHNSSDGDRHAPYGSYLFIQSTHSPIPAYKSYVIFAGYCTDKLSYSWQSNTQINITCLTNEQTDIRTHSKKAYGISINVTPKYS